MPNRVANLGLSDECTFGIRTLPQPEGDRLCPMGEPDSVSEVRHSSSDDLAREVAIQQLGRDIEAYMAEVAAINNRDPHENPNYADAAVPRAKANLARQEMEALIRARSPEQVARMEEQRGLR